MRSLFVSFCILLVIGCARAPLKGPENALRPASAPFLSDDLELEPLLAAVETQCRYIEASPGFQSFVFGETTYTKAEYLSSLRRFIEFGRTLPVREDFLKKVSEEFQFFEVYGRDNWSEAFFTSYYEPIIPGSLKKTARFNQPIYKQPDDLVRLELNQFDEKFAGERRLRGRVEMPPKDLKMTGLTPPLAGPVPKFMPYYTREQIDMDGALKGKKLELLWVDPFDAYLMQVQGSGTVDLGKGKRIRLGYSEMNGHKYESLGKPLKDVIPAEQMNLHTMEAHLRHLPEAEMRKILNTNPSYIFFKELDAHALTSLGVPATEGRTIAADQRYFPKGALGFLMATRPKFENAETNEPKEWEPFSRFVLDQDIGGAITGGGRADIFWGSGDEAKRVAGLMKQTGKLYYLAPKRAPQK